MGLATIFKRLQQALRESMAEPVEHGPVHADDGIVRVNDAWKPQGRYRRVEIMVSGDPSRIGAVADAIDEAQKHIDGMATGGQKLETRVTAFLDNCIHRSRWSKKPFKTAARAKRMHCQPSATKFADAFADSRGEMIDDIILIGDRFDDDFHAAWEQARLLKDQGVSLHCFHTGADKESRKAYEDLAQHTGGVFLQLADQRSLMQVMPILMAHLNDQDKAAMVDAGSRDQHSLLQKLKALNLTLGPSGATKD